MADLVRALTRGYAGNVLRETGEKFVWPEDVPVGSWVEPVEAGEADESVDGDEGGEPEKPVKPAKKGKGKKVETVEAPVAEPFVEPAEPVRVKNEANELTGSTHPDWMPPQQVEE